MSGRTAAGGGMPHAGDTAASSSSPAASSSSQMRRTRELVEPSKLGVALGPPRQQHLQLHGRRWRAQRAPRWNSHGLDATPLEQQQQQHPHHHRPSLPSLLARLCLSSSATDTTSTFEMRGPSLGGQDWRRGTTPPTASSRGAAGEAWSTGKVWAMAASMSSVSTDTVDSGRTWSRRVPPPAGRPLPAWPLLLPGAELAEPPRPPLALDAAPPRACCAGSPSLPLLPLYHRCSELCRCACGCCCCWSRRQCGCRCATSSPSSRCTAAALSARWRSVCAGRGNSAPISRLSASACTLGRRRCRARGADSAAGCCLLLGSPASLPPLPPDGVPAAAATIGDACARAAAARRRSGREGGAGSARRCAAG